MPKANLPKSLTDAPRVKVGVFDMDGILRGKIMSRNKFASALKDGFGFCDVVLGWDVDDQTYDNATFTGWHTAFPDARVRLLPTTRRDIPDEPDAPLALCEFVGDAEAFARAACCGGFWRARKKWDFPFAPLANLSFFFSKKRRIPRAKRAFAICARSRPGFSAIRFCAIRRAPNCTTD